MNTTNKKAGFSFIKRLVCIFLALAANQMLLDSADASELNLNRAVERIGSFDFESLRLAMNPDGTGQRAVYGSNSYWPNALYYPRGISGAPNKIIGVCEVTNEQYRQAGSCFKG